MCVTAPQFFGPFGRIRLDFSTLAPAARHDPPLLVNLSCLLAVRRAAAEKQVRLIVDALGTEENGMSSLGSTLLKHVQDAAAELNIALPGCESQDLESAQDSEMRISEMAVAARKAVEEAGREVAGAAMLRAVVVDAGHALVEEIRACSLSRIAVKSIESEMRVVRDGLMATPGLRVDAAIARLVVQLVAEEAQDRAV